MWQKNFQNSSVSLGLLSFPSFSCSLCSPPSHPFSSSPLYSSVSSLLILLSPRTQTDTKPLARAVINYPAHTHTHNVSTFLSLFLSHTHWIHSPSSLGSRYFLLSHYFDQPYACVLCACLSLIISGGAAVLLDIFIPLL